MPMIKFKDFFNIEFPDKTKVKFNMNASDKTKPAWDFLKFEDGSPQYKEWIKMNAHKKKHPNNNLNKADYLLAFAQYYPLGINYYIFGGMYKVEKIIPEVFDTTGYKLTLMDNFKEYRRRLIIKIDKPIGRDLYNRRYKDVVGKMTPEIYELLPTQPIEDFPGFNNVLLTHKQLQYIYNRQAPEWERQLSSVKGVYCITDTSNGKLYIGSAYGDDKQLWQRWSKYANPKNLTGENKEFIKINKKDPKHIPTYFTYAILEIFDPRTPDEEVIRRESFWKQVFKSRQFGMNDN